MANLFEESDFALFTQYQGKTRKEAPDGQDKLRIIYDKLGDVLSVLKGLGYHTEIIRNPLIQGGRATMKYCDYHWSKVYPKDANLYNGCNGKVFVVIGSAEDGINIHIDSNSRNGYNSDTNKVANTIKINTWCQIPPSEAALLSRDELANKVDSFIQQNWLDFNLFAKEFGVQESIKILNKMDIDKITKLLLSNHNIILTGAPGTGKTYLAKEIAKDMGAEWKLVQFHPSYDYTDFVEGLRPIKEGNKLGFQRKDGVFKKFCKKALVAINGMSFDEAYNQLIEDIKTQNVTTIKLKTQDSEKLGITDNNSIKWHSDTEANNVSSNVVSYSRLKQLYEVYDTIEKLENMNNIQEDIRNVIRGCNASYYWGVLNYILKYIRDYNSKPYVFIIDEINRGEISKVFGELFYSIDPGYRGKKGMVDTQYQNLIPKEGDDDFDSDKADVFRNGFYVPENVYIIGTMNDIDRSVESMDFAMRRRFTWKEITAESRQSMLDDEGAWGGNKPEQVVIDEIKVRMNNLNACIIGKYGDEEELSPKDRIGLTEAYQIGAAYFLKYGMYGNFDDLWTNHLKGLLYEYLRGTTNIEAKIERLQKAYNDTTVH